MKKCSIHKEECIKVNGCCYECIDNGSCSKKFKCTQDKTKCQGTLTKQEPDGTETKPVTKSGAKSKKK